MSHKLFKFNTKHSWSLEDNDNYAKNSLDKTLSGKPKMQKPYPIVRFHFHYLNCEVINVIHVTVLVALWSKFGN